MAGGSGGIQRTAKRKASKHDGQRKQRAHKTRRLVANFNYESKQSQLGIRKGQVTQGLPAWVLDILVSLLTVNVEKNEFYLFTPASQCINCKAVHKVQNRIAGKF